MHVPFIQEELQNYQEKQAELQGLFSAHMVNQSETNQEVWDYIDENREKLTEIYRRKSNQAGICT